MPRQGLKAHRHGDGWRVRWRVPGESRTQSVTWSSHRQAQRLCVEVMHRGYTVRATDPDVIDRSIVTGVKSSPAPEGVRTFRDAAEDRIAARKRAREISKGNYRRYLDRHCGALADLPVGDVTPALVAEWTQSLYDGETNRCARPHPASGPPADCRCGSPLAPSTVQCIYLFASGVMTRELREGRISSHPFASDDSLAPVTGGAERFIELDDWRRVRELIPTKTARDFADTLAATGCRWSEVAALQGRDVVTVGGETAVRVRRTWSRDPGKGYSSDYDPKARSRRTVVVDRETGAMLRARAEQSPECGYLFTSTTGRPYRYHVFYMDNWRPMVREAIASGVLGEWIVPHGLRHSHGSWLLAAGATLIEVSRRLGHASLKTTADVYSHLTDESGARLARMAGAMLAGEDGDGGGEDGTRLRVVS